MLRSISTIRKLTNDFGVDGDYAVLARTITGPYDIYGPKYLGSWKGVAMRSQNDPPEMGAADALTPEEVAVLDEPGQPGHVAVLNPQGVVPDSELPAGFGGGTHWFDGTDRPTDDTLGADGDYFVVTAGIYIGNVYKKIDGSWNI